MRGATSSDGKLTGNVQTVERYEDSKKPKTDGHDPNKGMDGGHEEIHSVVAQHGSADRHVITNSNGKVHSETHHKSGHIHHADHASLDEAHEHGKVAMEDAEHNTMGEDAALDAGERGGAEHLASKKTPGFMA